MNGKRLFSRHPLFASGRTFLVLVAVATLMHAQGTVKIHIDTSAARRPFPRVWNFFGYDEPNFSYAPNGAKLLREIADLSPSPAYVRVHNLLTSGDGTGSLKWGSTNAYTEDSSGRPVYDWRIIDQIFDTFRGSGLKPLVEIGFMPEALSTHPQPYRHNFPNGSIYTGWAYPPKDYHKWAELVFQFAKHLRERYGETEVNTWLWEVWNEPDIDYWKGTPEEYFQLYDYSAQAVRRALPGAVIGGPDSTGPARPNAIAFLTNFLSHCESGKNYATGETGAPLDFISFHPKGSPVWQTDHVQMGLAAQLKAIEQGFKIVAGFPKWRNTPIILGEWDPEGCAACSAQKNPQNGYRNGALYATYTLEAFSQTLALARQYDVQLRGMVTWAFEFEDQAYFAGFRELATNGLDKPVLNAFRMLGLMGEDEVEAISSASLETKTILADGVRAAPDIRAIATSSQNAVQVLLWSYHDDDLSAPPASIELTISGVDPNVRSALIEHFRVDSTHSNSFTAWLALGSPSSTTPEQYATLESAGQLQMLASPRWVHVENRTLKLAFDLPRQGASLVRMTW